MFRGFFNWRQSPIVLFVKRKLLMNQFKKRIEAPGALTPPPWDLPDAVSLQALEAGEATPEQQKRALRWIIERGCAAYDLSARPDSVNDTFIAEGRRFVGLEIVKLLKINTAAFGRK